MDEQRIVEDFEERIAIMVVCGECREVVAIQQAFAELRRRTGRDRLPERVKELMRGIVVT